jgi:hypothetical protein
MSSSRTFQLGGRSLRADASGSGAKAQVPRGFHAAHDGNWDDRRRWFAGGVATHGVAIAAIQSAQLRCSVRERAAARAVARRRSPSRVRVQSARALGAEGIPLSTAQPVRAALAQRHLRYCLCSRVHARNDAHSTAATAMRGVRESLPLHESPSSSRRARLQPGSWRTHPPAPPGAGWRRAAQDLDAGSVSNSWAAILATSTSNGRRREPALAHTSGAGIGGVTAPDASRKSMPSATAAGIAARVEDVSSCTPDGALEGAWRCTTRDANRRPHPAARFRGRE